MSATNIPDEELTKRRDSLLASFNWWNERRLVLAIELDTAKKRADEYLTELLAADGELTRRNKTTTNEGSN